MKWWFYLIVIGTVFGCSKERADTYSQQLVGNWDIEDISVVNAGGKEIIYGKGRLSFLNGHQLTYTSSSGTKYTGSWIITGINNYYGEDTKTEYILVLDAKSSTGTALYDEFFISKFKNQNQINLQLKDPSSQVIYRLKRL